MKTNYFGLYSDYFVILDLHNRIHLQQKCKIKVKFKSKIKHGKNISCLGPTLNYYPSGGFIDDLGYEKDATEDVLTNLRIQSWFDHMTRAVFVELTLYNVNTGLFSQVILVAEQMPTGEYLVSAMVSFTIYFVFI